MAVLEQLDEDEMYLWAVLSDPSGLDQAEFCVAGGQLVLTARGWFPIEKVEVGDQVLTHKGRWRSVTAVHDRGVRSVVKVRGQGHPGLLVTSDHEFYVRSRVRGRQAVEGHRNYYLTNPAWETVTNRPLHNNNGRSVFWASSSSVEPLPTPEAYPKPTGYVRENLVSDYLSEEWLWLYGHWLAQGSVMMVEDWKAASWAVNVRVLDEIGQKLDAVGLHYNIRPTNSEKCKSVVVYGKQMVEWLLHHGGRHADGKYLATWVYGLSTSQRHALLWGYLSGDGGWTDAGYNSASSVSDELLWGMRVLAATLGHGPRLQQVEEYDSSFGTKGKPYLRLTLDRADGTNPRVHYGSGLQWLAVKEISDAGEAHVYDLSVEEDHSFVVEGVVVHNCWEDYESPNGVFRAWSFQWKWFRCIDPLQIDQAARAVGKSLSIKMRAFAFPFLHPGQEMLITAPELVHLNPIIGLVENQLANTKLTRELLPKGRSAGITHRPFECDFLNGARIFGRIPQRDGKGVKGSHPLWLEMDESQNYPDAGWVEVIETLKRGHEGAVWRSHGVTRGVRDYFYKFTQPNSGWTVHRLTAMHRPTWTDDERTEKIEQYGSRNSPDYKRNLLGLHGDATQPLFVQSRLFASIDDDITSDYNTMEYANFRITAEQLEDEGGDIVSLLDFPALHKNPAHIAFWAGHDVGFMAHPSEILVFAELKGKNGSKPWLKLLTRIHLERISHGDQVRAILHTANWYNVNAYSFDKTGVGLPLYQDIQDKWPGVASVIKGYTFNGKILVDFDKTVEVDEYKGDLVRDAGIERNVLEYATDVLRDLVDSQCILLPWDTDLIGEFQGQTYYVVRDTMNMYGKRIYSTGKFHALDAARMAVLGRAQSPIEELTRKEKYEPIAPVFIGF